MARKPAAPSIPGLTRRSHTTKEGRVHRAYYDRVLPEVGRIFKALECDYTDPAAVTRAQALNTLVDRGDLGVIARWSEEGSPSITEIARAVREGDVHSLRKLSGRSLKRAVDEFMKRAENTLNPKSVAQYDSILGQVVEHFGPDRALASITSEEAETFLHDRPNWKSASTQRDVKVLCGSVWGLAIEREREMAVQTGAAPSITLNPWRGKRVRVRTKTKPRHAYLLPDEWRALISHPQVRGTPTAALLGLGTLAGLRRGEICNLRTGFDVDLDAGLLRIQPRGGEYEWAPKGYSKGVTNSVRDVPIPPALRELLELHAEKFAGDRYFMHASHGDRPLSPATATNWTADALVAAGLTYGRDDEDSLTLHSLRHTYATWLVSDGIPIPTVAKLLGNTPEMVLSVYAHHMAQDEQRAVEVIQGRAT